MSAELDEVARALYNGQIPSIWRALAPATLKSLGNWMLHFLNRNKQYLQWVSARATWWWWLWGRHRTPLPCGQHSTGEGQKCEEEEECLPASQPLPHLD